MNLFAQCDSINKLQRDKVRVGAQTRVFSLDWGTANLVDVRDIWMIERGRGFGFLHKPSHAVSICSQISRKNLQRDFTIQLSVLCEVHFAHSAGAELPEDFIMAELCTRRER